MNPDYFAHISVYEAEHFAAGVRRRYREGWMQARLVAYMAAAPHCKNLDFAEVAQFSWESEDVQDVQSEDAQEAAIERLRAMVPNVEKMLKNGNS